MKLIRSILFIFILNAANSSLVLAEEASPSAVVDAFHKELLAVMKLAEKVTAKKRYALLEPAVAKAFDIAVMIRAASGAAWRKASDADKIKLVQAFHRMSVATYAFRFKGYSGQRFVTLKTTDGPRRVKLVMTQIVSPKNGKPDEVVKLTYVMKQYDGEWKIVDILLDGGISELSVKHSEYRTIVKSRGASGLADLLNKKADQLIAE